MKTVDHLILGFGYVATELKKQLQQCFPGETIVTTSRSGVPHILFDFNKKETWGNLPIARHTYWTFPAEPLSLVQEFSDLLQEGLGKLVIVGSTSAFKLKAENEEVTELTPLDLSIPRVQGESFLNDRGAVLVMAAGIYGPGRNPLDWVKKAIVGKSDKYVNMIHVEDLCQILRKAAQSGSSHEVFIASDGSPQKWRDVIEIWEEKGLLKNIGEKDPHRSSKKINPQKTLETLSINLKFRNFAQSVS